MLITFEKKKMRFEPMLHICSCQLYFISAKFGHINDTNVPGVYTGNNINVDVIYHRMNTDHCRRVYM